MEFDAILKTMLEAGPPDWPRLIGEPESEVRVIDADFSTVSGAADKVLHILGPEEWILHFEFQVGPDAAKPRKINLYNSVLEDRTGLPVRSVLILLRPEAYLRAYSGRYERSLPKMTQAYQQFEYDVLKVWQIPASQFLSGIGTLPLAPISAITEAELPAVLKEMKRRLGRKTPPSVKEQIWTSAYVLAGLRYKEEITGPLFEETLGMEESTTYQAILRKGEAKGSIATMQKTLLRLGELRFRLVPSKKVLAKLMKISDVATLEGLTDRILFAESWEDLLGLPERKR